MQIFEKFQRLASRRAKERPNKRVAKKMHHQGREDVQRLKTAVAAIKETTNSLLTNYGKAKNIFLPRKNPLQPRLQADRARGIKIHGPLQ